MTHNAFQIKRTKLANGRIDYDFTVAADPIYESNCTYVYGHRDNILKYIETLPSDVTPNYMYISLSNLFKYSLTEQDLDFIGNIESDEQGVSIHFTDAEKDSFYEVSLDLSNYDDRPLIELKDDLLRLAMQYNFDRSAAQAIINASKRIISQEEV